MILYNISLAIYFLTQFVYYFLKNKTRVLFMLQVITLITLLLHAKRSEMTLPFLNLLLPLLCSFY